MNRPEVGPSILGHPAIAGGSDALWCLAALRAVSGGRVVRCQVSRLFGPAIGAGEALLDCPLPPGRPAMA